MENFESLVKGWAEQRDLLQKSNPLKQWQKLGEELGEMQKHLFKSLDIRDDIGDQAVVLNVIAAMLGVSTSELVEVLDKHINENKLDLNDDIAALKTPFEIAANITGANADLGVALIQLYNLDSVEDEIAGEALTNVFGHMGLYTKLLNRMAEVSNATFSECCEMAWADISGRTGKTTDDGAFIKSNDEEAA